MVNALLAIVRAVWSVWLFETLGAALVIYGIWLGWGDAPALIAAGSVALVKSAELDLRSRSEQ